MIDSIINSRDNEGEMKGKRCRMPSKKVIVIGELNRLGVGTEHVTADPLSRTGATLSLTDGRDRSLLTYMGTIDAVTPAAIPDTTGAGDSFNAGWIAAMLEGRSYVEALKFANACGALSTLSIGGAGTLNLEGLVRFWPEGLRK
jgi:sugar/nucleoside kinase (ribokinase family)